MNIRATYKTMMKDFLKSAVIYYSVMLAVLLLGLIALLVFDNGNGSMGMNFDLSGYIFIFVFGLNSFKENFKFFNQNGVSRKTFYITRVAVLVSATLTMVVLDRILFTLISFINMKGFSVVYMFDFVTEITKDTVAISFATVQHSFKEILGISLASLCTYMTFYGMGCFINLVFYRLGNFGKTIVGAGVPVFCLILLPLADNILLNGAIGREFMKLVNFTFSSIGNISLVFILISLACMVFTYFLMRRAPIKN